MNAPSFAPGVLVKGWGRRVIFIPTGLPPNADFHKETKSHRSSTERNPIYSLVTISLPPSSAWLKPGQSEGGLTLVGAQSPMRTLP
eukprot:scaffold41385_cov69-Phaeocystis_antarctica.AAC.8